MKQLVLVDGTTYSVTDESSIGNIRIPIQEFAEVDQIGTKFTRENMETVNIGSQVFHQANPTGISAVKDDDGFFCVVRAQESLQDYVQNQIDNYTEMLIMEGVIE